MAKKKKKKPAQESTNMENVGNEESTEVTESVEVSEEVVDETSETNEEASVEETVASEQVSDEEQSEEAPSEETAETPEEAKTDIVEIASELGDKLSTMPPVEKVEVVVASENDKIRAKLSAYVTAFRKGGQVVKSKDTINKFAVELTRILMLIHKTQDIKVLDTYLEFMVEARDCNCDVVYAMDHIIKNGTRERNSIMIMHSTFSILARSVKKNTPFVIKDEVVRKELNNKAIVNYIFAKK